MKNKITLVAFIFFSVMVVLYGNCIFAAEGNNGQSISNISRYSGSGHFRPFFRPTSEDASGRLVDTFGCKETRAGSDDCLIWEYRDGTLGLLHENAGLNCCPGEITADVEIRDNSINIVEHEEGPGCNCLCLFDLTYKIRNLAPGEYTLTVENPYVTEKMEPLVTTIELEDGASGRFCVHREEYPW